MTPCSLAAPMVSNGSPRLPEPQCPPAWVALYAVGHHLCLCPVSCIVSLLLVPKSPIAPQVPLIIADFLSTRSHS